MAKFIKLSSGRLTEEAAVAASAGAGDAGKIPQLDAAGILASSIINSTTTSAGSGAAGKVVALDGSGRIDTTMMPVGVAADVAVLPASETLSAGDFVSIWSDAGVTRVRKADASTAGKEADGFVLSGASSGANATVYFEGSNTQLTGLTGGTRYYLATTPGAATTTPPTGAGAVVQYLGKAVGATEIKFEGEDGVILA